MYGVKPQDLFNADETGLFYGQVPFLSHGSTSSCADLMGRMPPDHGLSNKKCSGVKGTKVRLIYLLVSNADGSEKLPPPHYWEGKQAMGIPKQNWHTTQFPLLEQCKSLDDQSDILGLALTVGP
jgi:hypothetical protein